MSEELGSPGALSALGNVLIVGTGLIGTSIGLALGRRGVPVLLDDAAADVLAVAVRLNAGRVWRGERTALSVICTPPSTIAQVLLALQDQNVSKTYTDVAGVKAQVLTEAERLGCDLSTLVGGHPFAGRERGGPENADPELFLDRPWVLCPTPDTSAGALLAVRELVAACGGVAVVTSPDEHDRAAAWLSHLPQLLASALAAGAGGMSHRDLGLAGQGFRDLTRIADSPPGLWQEVVAGNDRQVALALTELQRLLQPVLEADDAARAGVAAAQLIHAGNKGRSQLPTKAGRLVDGETVVVAVSDRPGELARLLSDAAAAGVNIEDVHVQHGAAATRGLVDLDVASGSGRTLASALSEAGWHCWTP